ncbi:MULTISPECIES: anaerobic ribonucleoside-triphosphate reductase activating protein [unclassified Sedimentibacter]|uniref:anaerobic ribonucleoside-triphosphate reductase activating protein n=1 Tax=unclassified Sedimentibacter TaxID=2649220 RepID=UPI0027DF7641|nr:anaerobic ribonucleoside-triphosphate reductase activating protein [Sedimentibacter sp. MB35-C1]WMJ78369.1 anaerobic ribonucleoside-triphosphate reductase activating protein [Sedimentibacter sp. MB35-C1]
MDKFLYVADIVPNTIVDGIGFRTSLYLSGCDICCEGCHNRDLWDIKSGKKMKIDKVYKKITEEFTDITFIGGEPMMQAESLAVLAKVIKQNTDKNIWIYSGHTYEEIISNKVQFGLLELCDVLVDGKYEEEFFQNNLRFRGSSNQRIIDIKKSLKNNKVVLWKDDFNFGLRL